MHLLISGIKKSVSFFNSLIYLPRLTALENVALPLIYAGLSKNNELKKQKHVLELVSLTDRSSS